MRKFGKRKYWSHLAIYNDITMVDLCVATIGFMKKFIYLKNTFVTIVAEWVNHKPWLVGNLKLPEWFLQTVFLKKAYRALNGNCELFSNN